MINETIVTQAKYLELLALFPAAWHDKLRVYTGEELFYAYKLCKFKPGLQFEKGLCQEHGVSHCRKCATLKSGDITFAAIRTKLLKYLKGELNEWGQPMKPAPMPSAFGKLGRRFKYAFEEEMMNEPVLLADYESIDKLKASLNSKRLVA